jgi:hypothetical protein
LFSIAKLEWTRKAALGISTRSARMVILSGVAVAVAVAVATLSAQHGKRLTVISLLKQ